MPKRGERLRWPPRPRSRNSEARPAHTAAAAPPALAQPNENDASSESQSVESDASKDVMQQAHADLERGLEDTDCRNRAAELVGAKTSAPGAKP